MSKMPSEFLKLLTIYLKVEILVSLMVVALIAGHSISSLMSNSHTPVNIEQAAP